MLYLAELYLPRGGLVADVARMAKVGAANATDAGLGIRFMQAVFVPLDECCFVLYQAVSASDVTTAGQMAGLQFDRVSRATAVL
jgi:hypothetical protein